MTTIRAVLFDLDDTLFDHRGAVATAIVGERRALWGEGDDAADVRRWQELEEHHYHRYLAGEIDIYAQRRARAQDFARDYGVELDDDAATAWWDGYHRRYRAEWHLHDDVEPCLAALAGLRIGMVTNGDEGIQLRKVRAVGLEDRLDALVASGAFGRAKPDPAIFREACRRLDVEPAAAVYVGDRLHTDAIGAAHAGLTGVWIDRPGAATPADLSDAEAAGVPVIRTLDALPALVR